MIKVPQFDLAVLLNIGRTFRQSPYRLGRGLNDLLIIITSNLTGFGNIKPEGVNL
jgi:hypothetical protein